MATAQDKIIIRNGGWIRSMEVTQSDQRGWCEAEDDAIGIVACSYASTKRANVQNLINRIMYISTGLWCKNARMDIVSEY
jgi:hypothetical protein